MRAKDAIADGVLNFADIYGIHPAPFPRVLTVEQKEKLVNVIDKCYPFGQRSMHPYKMWLKERKVILDWLYPKEEEPINDGLFATD